MKDLKAVKDNREYTLSSEEEKTAYRARGFDIVDPSSGKVVEHGAGKKVALEEFLTVRDERDKLAAENKELKNEIKTLKKSGGDKEIKPDKGE